jgi:hypothetical protein
VPSTSTAAAPVNKFAIASAFMVIKRTEEQKHTQTQEETKEQHALSSASSATIWKNLTLQRRQSFGQMQLDLPELDDGGRAAQLTISPKTPSSSSRPMSSSHLRGVSSASPARRRPSSDSSPPHGDEKNHIDEGSTAAGGVVSDLRTLAAKFAHRVDVQRANLAHLGIEVPSSFSAKPPHTVAPAVGALGRRRAHGLYQPQQSPSPARPASSAGRPRSDASEAPTPGSSALLVGVPAVPRPAIRSANHQIVTSLVLSSKLPIASSVTPYLVAYERQGNMDFYTDSSKQSRADLKSHILIIDFLDRAWNSLPKTIPSGEYLNIEMFKWMHRMMYDHFCCADGNEHVWAQVVVDDWRMYGGVVTQPTTTAAAAPMSASTKLARVAGGSGSEAGSFQSSSSDAAASTPRAAVPSGFGGPPHLSSSGSSGSQRVQVIMDRAGFDSFLFAFIDVWSQTLDVHEYVALGEEALKVVVVEGTPYCGPLCETEEGLEAYRVAAAQQQRAAASAAAVGSGPSNGGASSLSRSNGAQVGGVSAEVVVDLRGKHYGSVNAPAAPDITWTKDMVVEAAEIRSLQAVAAAQQTSKVVDALATIGKSDLGVTEAKQLQGFIRVVCDIEEREEDELRRLTYWANTFLEDLAARCWWLVEPSSEGNAHGGGAEESRLLSSPSPTLSSPTTAISNADASSSLATIIRDLQLLLTTHSANVSEFSDAEGSERRSIVAAVSRLLEAVATAVAERDKVPDDSNNANDVSDVRKKITAHWKVGADEKRKLRGTLQRALADLKNAFRPALLSSSSGSSPSAPVVSAEERNVGLVLLRELDEIGRQADLDAARAQEETTLVEFLSAELAAQRPLTALMETALGNAQEASKANSKRQVKIGSESWIHQAQSLARVEVGLYHVVDAIHQELQKSVGAIVDSCEHTVMSALADDTGERFNRFPMHLTQRLDEGRDFIVKTCNEHRNWASVMISNLRLFSNEYFTKICPEEKAALAACKTEDDVRKALLIRDEVGAAALLVNRGNHLSSRPQSAAPTAATSGGGGGAPPSSRRDIEIAHRLAMHAAAAELMKKSPALQVPVSSFVRPTWFVISRDRARETYCATHIFPLLQQRNVAWSCTLLGELTEVVGHVTAALHIMRVEVEATLAEILAEAESLALAALASTSAAGSRGAVEGRRRGDRDVWNPAVDRSTIEHIQSTIQRLVSIPQSTMTAQHEFFLRKTFEWVERRWTTEAEIAAVQSEVLAVKKKSELAKLDRVGGSLADVHNELNKMDDVVVEHQLTSVDQMREDEEKHLEWMKHRRDMRVQGERQLRILRAVEGGALTVEQLDQRVRAVTKEQRDAVARAVIAQFAKAKFKKDNAPSMEALLTTTTTVTPAVSAQSGPTVSTGMARWLLASNVVKRGTDGSIVASFRAHPAVEKRRALYVKSKLSNVDVLVSDCTKRGAAIPDAIRVQLSAKPCIFDALVLPLHNTPSIGGGISMMELLHDLMWLNPLQYLSFNQCNLTNADVESLSKLLAGHPTVSCIDLRYNPQVTDAKPIIRMLDVNRATMLMVAVGHGTGLDRSALHEIETSCQVCRRERPSLGHHEALLMASHFSTLKSQRESGGDGKISHISVAAVAAEYKQKQKRQGCRGSSTHPIAALQGLVAVFIAESLPAIEAWSEVSFISALFPNWNSDQVQQVLDVFTSPQS